MSGFKQSLDYLYGLQKYGIKFGLNCTENLLAKAGNPHGSSVSFISPGPTARDPRRLFFPGILCNHGIKVGLYTSPHLVRFTERFRINDEEVSAERILRVFEKIRATLDGSTHPTFFEM